MVTCLSLSPPKRLPLGFPIKIATRIEKQKACGGRWKEGKGPFPSCPARFLFLPPQPPRGGESVFKVFCGPEGAQRPIAFLSFLLILSINKTLHSLIPSHFLWQNRYTIDHFTVMSLVPQPLNEREAEIDLVLRQTSFLFLYENHAK